MEAAQVRQAVGGGLKQIMQSYTQINGWKEEEIQRVSSPGTPAWNVTIRIVREKPDAQEPPIGTWSGSGAKIDEAFFAARKHCLQSHVFLWEAVAAEFNKVEYMINAPS
jgi:hypothetical protein